jgi:hypothetical protein
MLCACGLGIMDHGVECPPCASDQYLVFTVDNRDISAVRPTDWIQRSSLETVDGDQSRGLLCSFIHRRRALDHEIQDDLIIQQARDAPGSQLAYTVARHHQRARYFRAHHGPGRHRLGAAQDLSNLVRVQRFLACLAHQLPRIRALQNRFGGL